MAGYNDWDEQFFGCLDDCETCLCGCFCTPCLFGQNVEKIDGSSCCLFCCLYACLSQCYLCWVPHYFKRENLREKYRLQEDSDCGDCPATCCCGPCAICQEARFLKRRALQPVMIPQMVQPGRNY